MLSIQIQNKDIIYYKPNIQKFYVSEREKENKTMYELRASIDNNDRLLGTFSRRIKAQEVMLDLLNENFWTNSVVFTIPKDETL